MLPRSPCWGQMTRYKAKPGRLSLALGATFFSNGKEEALVVRVHKCKVKPKEEVRGTVAPQKEAPSCQ